MKASLHSLRRFIFLGMAAVVLNPLYASFPEDSIPPLKEAQQRVNKADWAGAIDAYSEHLSKLTPRHYRDKKTYGWILEEYEKSHPSDFAAIREIAESQLESITEDQEPIRKWRLHQLLAVIAEKEGETADRREHLLEAIEAYPGADYPEPAKLSKLQHLYNEVALMEAEDNPEAAEAWLVEQFLEDDRFQYVFVPAWKRFYQKHQIEDRYRPFVERVIEACHVKAANHPEQTDYYRFIRSELSRKLPD